MTTPGPKFANGEAREYIRGRIANDPRGKATDRVLAAELDVTEQAISWHRRAMGLSTAQERKRLYKARLSARIESGMAVSVDVTEPGVPFGWVAVDRLHRCAPCRRVVRADDEVSEIRCRRCGRPMPLWQLGLRRR